MHTRAFSTGVLALMSLSAAVSPPSFTEHKLKNGLRVILAEDRRTPTVSLCVAYNVGSRDERPGRTGFAHLFEHLMFQGSENVGKGEHFLLISGNGGSMNGTTSADRTVYYETLPSQQLDLGLYLEADRMRSLAITQANLDNQRATVKEERRQNFDNRAYGRLSEILVETVFDSFAYKHSTIGSMADLDGATVEEARQFFKTYYAPNNAVLTVVGDFDSKTALDKVKSHFEGIAAQEAPPAPEVQEPEQTEERRRRWDDAHARFARLDLAYKVPAGNSPDYLAMNLFTQVLAGGYSGRLYQSVVRDQELALSASAGLQERPTTSLFVVSAIVKGGLDPAATEKALLAEIEKLKTGEIADWEIDKARMHLKRQFVQGQMSTLGRAVQLAQSAVFYGNPAETWNRPALAEKVTKADVQRVAKKYLVTENRSVILTAPVRRGGSR